MARHSYPHKKQEREREVSCRHPVSGGHARREKHVSQGRAFAQEPAEVACPVAASHFQERQKRGLTPYDAVLSFFLEYISCIIMATGNARHGVLQL